MWWYYASYISYVSIVLYLKNSAIAFRKIAATAANSLDTGACGDCVAYGAFKRSCGGETLPTHGTSLSRSTAGKARCTQMSVCIGRNFLLFACVCTCSRKSWSGGGAAIFNRARGENNLPAHTRQARYCTLWPLHDWCAETATAFPQGVL